MENIPQQIIDAYAAAEKTNTYIAIAFIGTIAGLAAVIISGIVKITWLEIGSSVLFFMFAVSLCALQFVEIKQYDKAYKIVSEYIGKEKAEEID